MKKIITIITCLFFFSTVNAQEELYLTFEFMKVKEINTAAYLETEEFWAGIHKERVEAGEIIGWDLWRLEPGGQDQGYQYMTVTLFKNLADMMRGISAGQVNKYAKKAYPKMSQVELDEHLNNTPKSRVLGMRYYLEEINATEDGPVMKLGNVAQIDFMDAIKDTYEAMESMIYRPWHQKMVNDGAKDSWSMQRVLHPSPSATDSYISHFTVNMFEDMDAFVNSVNYDFGDDNVTLNLATEEASKTRNMRKILIGILEKMVR